MRAFTLLPLAALVAAGSAIAKDRTDGKTTAAAVLERLIVADKGEVQIGQLAISNGTAKTQDYGKILLRDHQTSLTQVQSLAKEKGVKLGEKPRDELAQEEQQQSMELHQKLAKLHGLEFDHAFSRAMVEDHQKDIDHLKQWRAQLNDADVVALIDQTLPVLDRHLDEAKRLQGSMPQARTPPPRR